MGVRQERNGNEHEIGERKDDEEFEMFSLRCASEDEHSDVK